MRDKHLKSLRAAMAVVIITLLAGCGAAAAQKETTPGKGQRESFLMIGVHGENHGLIRFTVNQDGKGYGKFTLVTFDDPDPFEPDGPPRQVRHPAQHFTVELKKKEKKAQIFTITMTDENQRGDDPEVTVGHNGTVKVLPHIGGVETSEWKTTTKKQFEARLKKWAKDSTSRGCPSETHYYCQ
ncbi:hypothetical protein [Actinomadura sp. B10D3]|uniref:hypothetical protein n=1 Tax=Actinomadura sp. B10D3 TaxID=3153557 RepID=UPI00325CD5B8